MSITIEQIEVDHEAKILAAVYRLLLQKAAERRAREQAKNNDNANDQPDNNQPR